MSKLTKEAVLSQLEGLLSDQAGKKVSIEQKGSWYKIDGGKSVRFSELEAMLTELTANGANTTAKSATESATIAAKATTAATTKITAATDHSQGISTGGQTPKQLWRQKLAGQGQLPRGF